MHVSRIALAVFVALPNGALAATSALNNNMRVLEDTLWLTVFTLMIIAGTKLSEISSGGVRSGYFLLTLAGISGWLWKGIGLVKRVMLLDEPQWLFGVARETFEGLTGILLAIALLVLVVALRRIYRV